MRYAPRGSFAIFLYSRTSPLCHIDSDAGGRAYLEAAGQLTYCKVRCTFKILSFTSFRRDDKMGRLFYMWGLFW